MLKKFMVILLGVAFLLHPLPAFADHGGGGPHGGGGGYHGGGGYSHGGGYHGGYVVHRLPAGYVSLMVGGLALLYCEGLFYRYTTAGYIVVQPPMGAVVPALPPGYTTVFVNGMPYYYYGYTYYTPAPTGYMVAAPPVVVPAPVAAPMVAPVPPPPVPATPSSAPAAVPLPAPTGESNDIDTFEIHIPNGDGSFTLVTLKKTDKGFLGPQGEFYPDHPTVDQLKQRYIKNKK